MTRFKKVYKYIYAISVVLVFWYLLHIILNSFVVPNPIDVIKKLFQVGFKVMSTHLVASLFRLLIALTITITLGYLIGLLIGINNKIDNLISPIVYLFFPVPRIAFLPVFMILFGLGNTSKVVLIIAIAIFQIIISVRDGAKEISKELILSAKSLKLSKAQMIKHIYIPATLPRLFTSLRIALGSSIAALFFAENYATKYGIGYYIMNSWIKVDYEGMYAGIILISLLGITMFKIIDILQNRICKWESK
ncbi:MAG: ABC transporter permease [Clostridium sp.]|uniref:ABC transporter permease n=1 Tax=Clostridium TaxID=1485 RepID=UPI0020292B73|nr:MULTISPECIES: ABC transporter permease [Clostridium]MDB1931956.1 ABC transporter permease [Clostridium tertium]MDB1935581.1 ABC transporter permease [Clostridium tertium]MDU7148061.1 ABC transporter permease [Clostridium sp.]MDY4606651.1 ABC transporter permease [Clostridium tertium]